MLDIEIVKEYIKILEESSLAVLEVTDEEESIRLEKPMPDSPAVVACAPAQAQTPVSQPQTPAASAEGGFFELFRAESGRKSKQEREIVPH